MSMVAVGITVDEAERITEQIVGRIDSISENVDVVMGLMREALSRNAHDALGYVSPSAYIADRFGDALSGLSASLRREFVHELSEAGMSARAIAPVFGVTHKTIVQDRQVVPPVPPATPEPIQVDTSTGEVIDAPVTVTETHAIKTVTGLDGKTYKRPEPKPVQPARDFSALSDEQKNFENAKQAAVNIGRGLETLSGFRSEQRRTLILTGWWPLAKNEVPPSQSDLFNPEPLREIAAALNQLANEMEAQRV